MPRKSRKEKYGYYQKEYDNEYKKIYEGTTRECPMCGGDMRYIDNWYFFCDKCNYGYTRDSAYREDYGEGIDERYAPDWEDD